MFLRGALPGDLWGLVEVTGSCLELLELAEGWELLAREPAVLWEREGASLLPLPAFCLKLSRRAAGSCMGTAVAVLVFADSGVHIAGLQDVLVMLSLM